MTSHGFYFALRKPPCESCPVGRCRKARRQSLSTRPGSTGAGSPRRRTRASGACRSYAPPLTAHGGVRGANAMPLRGGHRALLPAWRTAPPSPPSAWSGWQQFGSRPQAVPQTAEVAGLMPSGILSSLVPRSIDEATISFLVATIKTRSGAIVKEQCNLKC